MNLFDVLFAKKLAGGGSPFPPVIKRKTGNPIEITDAAAAPIVKCVSEIQGSQDLHGYDKPWVGGAGKNKLDPSTKMTTNSNTRFYVNEGFELKSGHTYTLIFYGNINLDGIYINSYPDASRVTVVYNAKTLSYTPTEDMYVSFDFYKSGEIAHDDNLYMLIEGSDIPTSWTPYSNICPITAYTEGEIEVRGKNIFNKDNPNVINTYISTYEDLVNNTNTRTIYIKCEPNTAYTVSKNAGQRFSVGYTKTLPANGVHVYGAVVNDTGTSITITTGSDAEYLVAYIYHSSYDSGTAQDMYNSVQIEKGTTPTTYEPYTSTTHTTTYPSAIYRGSEDVVNGEVTTEQKKIVFTGANTEQWNMSSGDNYYQFFTPERSDIKSNNLLCNIFETITISDRGTKNGIINNNDGYIRFALLPSLGVTDVAGWRQFLSDHNAEVVADLATTTTEQITVSNLPIKSLSGYNHIESSTGDMVVDYITDAYQNFVDTTERALPNTRKGGTKAFDIFETLDNPGETPNEETTDTDEKALDESKEDKK